MTWRLKDLVRHCGGDQAQHDRKKAHAAYEHEDALCGGHAVHGQTVVNRTAGTSESFENAVGSCGHHVDRRPLASTPAAGGTRQPSRCKRGRPERPFACEQRADRRSLMKRLAATGGPILQMGPRLLGQLEQPLLQDSRSICGATRADNSGAVLT
jgi:hypothetical protein